MEKSEIRSMVKKLRKEMPGSVLLEKSQIICRRAMELSEFSAAGTVLAYMDCKGEVSTKPLIEEAWRLGKKVAVPKVEGDDMYYYYIDSFADVADGYFHVPEPLEGQKQCQAEAEDAVLIVPGVGFDQNRNRCGYGKGFYDRYLAAHRRHFTVALAFDFQIVDEVPVRPEDIRPQMLITETRSWSR
ncbi:MAG: 5-formyltetrahydrofolate cyclo-ligase [Lachnospiraceae bacterium]|nr:5-formyltetrahydrofolate cyclo-ligase [Lachnospiraceae bacterium]